MKTCIFVGPTYAPTDHPFDLLAPAKMGSVYLAVKAGYERIALVDGVFGNCASVRHKEVLFALSEGVAVYGAASMGALRAAELDQFGMQGIGRIYRLYRDNWLTDDDEVCQLHGPRETNYKPTTEALVNIRFSLDRLHVHEFISIDAKDRLIQHMKAIHFSDRTERSLIDGAAEILGTNHQSSFKDSYKANKFNAKQSDSIELFTYLKENASPNSQTQEWTFPVTNSWLKEICDSERSLCPLEKWS